LNESILLVDDDINVSRTLCSILINEGYLVETVENGKQAIRALEKLYFDLALRARFNGLSSRRPMHRAHLDE
jgi:CheY-like chemotaxis protein